MTPEIAWKVTGMLGRDAGEETRLLALLYGIRQGWTDASPEPEKAINSAQTNANETLRTRRLFIELVVRSYFVRIDPAARSVMRDILKEAPPEWLERWRHRVTMVQEYCLDDPR